MFMFSGQGSQYYQMGRGLFEHDLVFRSWLLELDAIARRLLESSVLDAMYDPSRRKGEPFDRITLTHPAIFMVEFALAQALIARGVRPDGVLGVSLGTLTAAAVAGCLGPEEALTAVVAQARAIEAHCRPGGLIAILAEPEPLERDGLCGLCEIAASNGPAHFVVAAPASHLDRIEKFLRDRQVTFQRLPVPYAFHSRWIEEAKRPCQASSTTIPFRPPRMPLMCCANARMVTEMAGDYLWAVARGPIRFGDAIACLERDGGYRYVDVGPSASLAAVLRHVLPAASASDVRSVLTPFGGDVRNLEAMTGA